MQRVVSRNTLLDADRIPTEHLEQREFVKWFRQNHKDTRILAVANGGQRTPATAARLKAEGVSAGVPDLFIPAWKLWIEMKRTSGGKVSPDQKDWIKYLNSVGYSAIVCNGHIEAIEQINKWTRESKEWQ